MFFSFVRKKCFVDAGIKRAGLAVDYAPAVLWITGLTALWITRARLAVDYACWHMLWITRLTPLWISGGVGAGFIVAPSHCGGGE